MKKLCALLLTLTMVVSALPFSFAASVTGISFTPQKTQFLFETDGEWRKDGGGNDYFYYDLMHYVGEKMVIHTDIGEDYFTCFYNEEENRMEFVNDNDPYDTLSADDVRFVEDQEQNHWGKGENTYQVDWFGKRATATATVADNPVSSIRYEPAEPMELLQECGGHWETDENNTPYYRYHLDMVHPGDKLYVSYTNGSESQFTAYYDEAADEIYFENESGERIEYGWFGVNCFEDQNKKHFATDEGNYYHVVYSGRYCDVSVSVVPNEVEAISYQPKREKTVYFENDGRWETGENGQEFFRYDFPRIEEGDVLAVTNVYDETVTYTARWDEQERHMVFESESGDAIWEDKLEFYDNQAHEPFEVGTNYYYVKYSGREFAIPVQVIESQIAAISYQPRVAKVLLFESDGNVEQGDNGQAYFRYNIAHMDDGDILTVTDKEGNDTVYTARWDSGTARMYFESEGGDCIDQDELNFYDEQHRSPFTLGTNYYYLNFRGKSTSIAVQLIENPVSEIRYEPNREKQYFVGTGGRVEQDDNGNDYYHYDVPFTEPGDRLIVTDNGGVETVYTAYETGNDGHVAFRSEAGAVIAENEINAYDEQHRYPFVMGGEHNYYTVRYSGRTCTVPVSITESPVKSVTYTVKRPIVLYENSDGQWETDGNGEAYFRYFGVIRISDGDILTVTDADDNSTDYVCRWNSSIERHEFVAANGDVIHEDDVRYVEEQNQTHFTVGGGNCFYVEYAGKRVAVPVSVVKNPVSAVQYTPARVIEIYENTGGEWRQNAQGEDYYNYSTPWFEEGDVLTVTWSETGETVDYTFARPEGKDTGFYDADGNKLDTDDMLYTGHEGNWERGSDNTMYVEYCGLRSNTVAVSIVENNVAAIRYEKENAVACYLENGGEWDTDGMGNAYYRYRYEEISEGDRLIVVDKNGEETVYTAVWDEQQWHFIFEAENGDTLLDDEISIYDRQYDVHFVLGDTNCFYVEYRGQVATVPVTVMESPIQRIDFVPNTMMQVYFETNGHFESDSQGGNYFRYDFGRISGGDRLIVTYAGGDEKTFSASWDDEEEEWVFTCADACIYEHELDIFDRQYEEHFNLGDNNFYYISYLGRTCAVPVSVLQNPVKAVEFVPKNPQKTIVEFTRGYWRDEDGTQVFRYFIPDFEAGDVLKVTAADDTVTVYTYSRDEETYREAFFDSEGNALEDDTLGTERDWSREWTTGADDNAYWVSVCGVPSNSIQVSVIQNPIAEITYTPATPIRIYEYTNGHIDNSDKIFVYNTPIKCVGDILTVRDREGNVSEYVFKNVGNDWYFENENGERIDEDDVRFDSNQYQTPWVLGTDNVCTVEYQNVTTAVYVEIAENPVTAIAFVPQTQPIVIDEYTHGEIEYGMFVYDIPIFTGDTFVVTYKTGEVVTYTIDAAAMTITAGDGREISVNEVMVYTNQWRQWSPDNENLLTIEYAGLVVNVPVTIRETFQKSVVAPTCTASGYTEHTDAASGISYRSDYTAPLGHDFCVKVMNAETLRDAGDESTPATYYYTCARCDAVAREKGLFFEADSGIIKGALSREQNIQSAVQISLCQGGEEVKSVTLYPWNGVYDFTFYNVQPGEYTLVMNGTFSPEITVLAVSVGTDEIVDLSQSENADVRLISAAWGDVNSDNVIDIADVTAVLSEDIFGEYAPDYDVNSDNIVNIRDIAVILSEQNYGRMSAVFTYEK